MEIANNLKWIVIGIFSWLIIENVNTIISVFIEYLLLNFNLPPLIIYCTSIILSFIVMLGLFYYLIQLAKVKDNSRLLLQVFILFLFISFLSYFIFEIFDIIFHNSTFSKNLNTYFNYTEGVYGFLFNLFKIIKNLIVLFIIFRLGYLKNESQG
jgi:hypothetical protein